MTARFASILCLLLVLFALPSLAQQLLITEDKFTALYVEALRAQVPEVEIQVTGRMELTLDYDGEQVRSYLDNAYARYSGAPDRLDEIISDYVLATVESLHAHDAKTDVARIVPVIKEAGYLEGLGEGVVGDEAAEIAHERYNDHLIILYAEDTPHNIRYLGEEHLDELGVDRAGLRQTAIDNLDRLLPDVEARGADGTYMLIADGNYEASLLLFDDIWSGDIWTTGSLPVAGEVVIAVPARDVLVVTGSRDAAGLAMLREIAADVVANDPYYLTDQLFIYRDGRFQPFEG